MIAPDDRGFTLGDGLFETLLALDGVPVHWDEHITRMMESARALGLPKPDAEAALNLVEASLKRAGLATGRAAVRINWSAGSGGRGLDRPAALSPALTVTVAAAPPPAGPARLITVSVRRNDTSPASRHKTLSYLDNVLARGEAIARGADEALMLNTRGEVACAAAANIFGMADGRLHTPDLACGVLNGIARGMLINHLQPAVVQTRAGPEALAKADAIFLTNSLIGVRDVAELDGRRLPQQVGQEIVVTLRGRL